MPKTPTTSLVKYTLQYSHALFLIVVNSFLAYLTFKLAHFFMPHLSAAPSLLIPMGAVAFKSIAPAVAGFLAGSIPVVGNPVNALFSLILILGLCVTMLIQNGAEYSGFVVAIVQIGGVSILFLFVIISLNLYRSATPEAIEGDKAIAYYLAPALLLLLSLRGAFHNLFELHGVGFATNSSAVFTDAALPVGDIVTVAQLLFGELSPLFILSGFLLLTAMLGAIVLATATLESARTAKWELRYDYNGALRPLSAVRKSLRNEVVGMVYSHNERNFGKNEPDEPSYRPPLSPTDKHRLEMLNYQLIEALNTLDMQEIKRLKLEINYIKRFWNRFSTHY